jgi:hypothetical protein
MSKLTSAEQQDKMYRELAATIADQAQAIADGTLTGPRYARARLILRNAEVLVSWTPDDRSGMTPAAPPAETPETCEASGDPDDQPITTRTADDLPLGASCADRSN